MRLCGIPNNNKAYPKCIGIIAYLTRVETGIQKCIVGYLRLPNAHTEHSQLLFDSDEIALLADLAPLVLIMAVDNAVGTGYLILFPMFC